jgi:hypothetical protein
MQTGTKKKTKRKLQAYEKEERKEQELIIKGERMYSNLKQCYTYFLYI